MAVHNLIGLSWRGKKRGLEFKYLGISFTCDGKMKKAAERMQGPFALAMAKVIKSKIKVSR